MNGRQFAANSGYVSMRMEPGMPSAIPEARRVLARLDALERRSRNEGDGSGGGGPGGGADSGRREPRRQRKTPRDLDLPIGADVVCEASGASRPLDAALKLVRPDGQVVKVGWSIAFIN